MTAMMVSQTVQLIGVILNLQNATLRDDEIVAAASCAVTLRFDGLVTYTGNNNPANPSDQWVTRPIGFGAGSKYEAAYTVLVSGQAPSSGSGLGVYNPLSSNRTWTYNAGSGDVRAGVIRIRVRKIADTSDFSEADFNITAFSSPI